MDADEALARQLQAEEDAHGALQRQRQWRQAPGDAAQLDFMRQLQSGVQTALRYEVPGSQDAARQAMPLERLSAAADDAAALSRQMGEEPPLHCDDALVQEMLAWFKTGFFTWVDASPCDYCGSRETFCTGTEAPSPQEAADGDAGRTEVYRCTACSAVTRFPRYNDPVKLLRTRRGRCGEWANCFGLCLRAAGLEARWVRDWADHVWCEYYSEGLGRWVHADPCEAAWDRPLLYEAGWGKQQSYVVAFGRRGAADVTRRYTADFAGALSGRTLVSESSLQTAISSVSSQLRSGLPVAEARKAEAADAAEAAQLAAGGASASAGPLPGRQTGSVEWRATRGELGAPSAHPAAKAPAPPAATRWRRAGDGRNSRASPALEVSLNSAQRHVSGAAIRASGENAPLETALKVLDGRSDTKWLDFGGGTPGQATWLEVALLLDSCPADSGRLASYALTAAGDAPERDPADWVLEGLPAAAAAAGHATARRPPAVRDDTAQPAAQAAAGAVATAAAGRPPAAGDAAGSAAAGARAAALQGWLVLDAREGVRFGSRGGRLEFQLAKETPACSRWRLTVSRLRDPQAACAVQLAGLDLYCHPDVAQAPSQQLGRLGIRDGRTPGAAGGSATCSDQPDSAAQPGSTPDAGVATAAGAATAAAAAAAALPGSSAGEVDAKAAFQQRVHEHFSRLMAGGGLAPAAAAAQALQLAAQGFRV